MQNPSSPQPPPHKLERIGRYRIVRPLSKGGMALVYEARRESLAGVAPRVAIKLILPDYASSDTFQELFINEARLGASMEHQNLVQIQDFNRDGESFYIVMEYVEGLTLRRAITLCMRNNIPIPMGVIAEIGRQACDGLFYAHTASDDTGGHLGLVHRDIKPSNLILNPQGVVKILDFGIARGRLMREKKGSVKGTWGYMAPEQAIGEDVGPGADVFGLGTVLYEMAAQHPLFNKKKPAEIKRLLLDDHAARMAATLDPSYGPLVNVLVRALQRDASARFTSAQQFGRALSALLPDPITSRDEVTRFYSIVNALNEGLPVPASSRSPHTGTGYTNASIGGQASSASGAGPLGLVVVSSVFGGLALMGVVVLAGAVFAPSLWNDTSPTPAHVDPPSLHDVARASDPEPDAVIAAPDSPAPPVKPEPPRRLPPSGSVQASQPEPVAPKVAEVPKGPEPVKVVVNRNPPPPPPAVVVAPPVEQVAVPPVAVDGVGLLTISSVQPAEVYVDGKFVRKIPLVRREFPAGRHVVTIVAQDGRRQSVELMLQPDQELRRVWDFDRAEWKK